MTARTAAGADRWAWPPVDPDVAARRLEEAAGAVRTELTRVDAKASTLLGLAGAALAVLVTGLAGRDLPVAADVAGWMACGIAGMSVLLVMSVVRPSLGGGPTGWFGPWAAGPAAVLDDLCTHRPSRDPADAAAVEVAALSAIALRKFRRLKHAVDALAAAVVVAGLVPVLAVVTR